MTVPPRRSSRNAVPMFREVESQKFLGFINPKVHEEGYEFDDQIGHQDGKYTTDGNTGRLMDKLGRVAEEQTVGTGFVNGFGGKQSGCQSAPGPSDAMYSEGVQRIVVAEFCFHNAD